MGRSVRLLASPWCVPLVCASSTAAAPVLRQPPCRPLRTAGALAQLPTSQRLPTLLVLAAAPPFPQRWRRPTARQRPAPHRPAAGRRAGTLGAAVMRQQRRLMTCTAVRRHSCCLAGRGRRRPACACGRRLGKRCRACTARCAGPQTSLLADATHCTQCKSYILRVGGRSWHRAGSARLRVTLWRQTTPSHPWCLEHESVESVAQVRVQSVSNQSMQ